MAGAGSRSSCRGQEIWYLTYCLSIYFFIDGVHCA